MRKLSPFKRYGSWLIFFVALLARGLHLLAIQKTPLGLYLWKDCIFYDEYAWKIATGMMQTETLYLPWAPVYLGFLDLVYTLFGHSMLIARMFQAVLGSLTCVLIYKTGKLLWNKQAGSIAGLIASFYGVFIFSDGLIHKIGITTFLLALSLYLLTRAVRKPSLWLWVVSAAAFTSAALLRLNLLIFIPILALWILFVFFPKKKWMSLIYLVLFFAASFATHKAWYAWFDQAVSHYEAAFPQTGINLYLGNNPESRGDFTHLEGMRSTPAGHSIDAKTIVEEKKGRKVTQEEVNEYWLNKTREYIITQPGHWVLLELKKLFLIFNTYEVPHDNNYPYLRQYSRVLSLPLFSFGLICPLGLLGIILCDRKKDPAIALWLLFLFSYILSLLIMIITMPYRLPIQIPLILFAAYAVQRLYQLFRSKRVKELSVACLLFLVLFLFTNYQTYLPVEDYDGMTRSKILVAEKEAKAAQIPEAERANQKLAEIHRKIKRAQDTIRRLEHRKETIIAFGPEGEDLSETSSEKDCKTCGD